MAAPITIIQATPPIAAAQTAVAGAAGQATPASSSGDASFAALVQKAGETVETPQAGGAAGSTAATNEQAALLAALMQREITPADATELLDQMEASGQLQAETQGDAQGHDNPLKQQLLDIIITQTPKPVGEIIADASAEDVTTLPALQEADTAADSLGAAAQRMIHFISKTLAKKDAAPTKELPQEANADITTSVMNPALMLLATAPFQADGDAPEPEEASVEQHPLAEESPSGVVNLMLPVAQQAVVAVPAAQAATATDDVQSTDVEAIDARIPSLKLTEKKSTLPDVTLPGAKAVSAKEDTLLSGTPAAFKDLAEHAAQQPLAQDAAKDLTAHGIHAIQHPAAMSHSSAVSEAAPVVAPHGIVNHAPVTDQVSVAIRQANAEGIEKITVQLDPVDLGRVEVNMHIGKDGHAQVTFLVDKPETFDALSRDARHLERSLQEAGIKADTGGMQFNLRQQPQPQFQNDTNGSGKQQHDSQNDAPGGRSDDKVVQLTPAVQNYRINIHEGLDIRA